MEVTRYLVRVEVDENNYVYINTLNGALDIVEHRIDKLVEKWIRNGSIICRTKKEEEIYDYLLNRGYIVEDDVLNRKRVYRELEEQLKTKQKIAKRIGLIITYDCNFRCSYCYEGYLQEKGSKWLDKKLTFDMIDNIYKNYGETVSTISLFGGEPLLLENFQLVKYILENKKNAHFHITTNGYYLEEYIDLLRGYNINPIEITLDGSRETHNKRRYLSDGGETYDKIIRGIQVALENDFKIVVRMNVDNKNESEANNLYSELMRLKGEKNNLSIYKSPLFNINQTCVNQLFTNMIMDSKDELGIKLNKSIEAFFPISKVFKGTGTWDAKYAFCEANEGMLFFDPHGDVYTCWLAVGDEELSIGTHYPRVDIDKNNLWHNRTVETIEKCNRCNKALLCGGGCGKEAYDTNNSLMNSNCGKTNYMLYKVIPLLYKNYKAYNEI